MKACKGHSYRPDNILYTKTGKFGFIDTEYPHLEPDFEELLPYLSEEMREFWILHVLTRHMSGSSAIDNLARKKKNI